MALVAFVCTGWWISRRGLLPRRDGPAHHDRDSAGQQGFTADAISEPAVRAACSHCHLFPEPEILPRERWRKVVPEMVELPGYGVNLPRKPPPRALIEWYASRAPERLVLAPLRPTTAAGPLAWRREPLRPAAAAGNFLGANVRLVDFDGDQRLEIVVCEMREGGVYCGTVADRQTDLRRVAEIAHPCRAQSVDLDGDGRQDLVVANLGSFLPLDHTLGSVEWLRGRPAGEFERVTLVDWLGRVADVRPADIDGDGDIDLAVAEFGWRTTGRVLVLENQTRDWTQPRFAIHPLDGRPGAIDVPIVDLDGDGRLDIVALIAQEHEMVVVYLNRGNWYFEPQILHRAPHPSWGFSGMDVADLDSDGDADFLLTNGDMFDDAEWKPYHGVQWLENLGNLKFAPHPLLPLYGAHDVLAADLDDDDDLDVIASAFPQGQPPEELTRGGVVESLLWLEQTSPGRFIRHTLEVLEVGHPAIDVGDVDGDGDLDLAAANGSLTLERKSPPRTLVDLWLNETPRSN